MDEQSERSWTPCAMYDSDRYSPSVSDVLSTKAILLGGTGLPLELIDPIIDFAEYWPHTTTSRSGPTTVRAGRDHEDQFILRSYPLGLEPELESHPDYQITDYYMEKYPVLAPQPWPSTQDIPNNATQEVIDNWTKTSHARIEYPCRKIVFTISSHDQGWGGGAEFQKGYRGSFSWFDVGREELFAFRENAVLEAWDLAPRPQFRLGSGSNKAPTKGSDQATTVPSVSSLVCSLRTTTPPTKQFQYTTERADDDPGVEQNSFKHELIPSGFCIQKNVVAKRTLKTHVVTWKYNDSIDPNSLAGDALEDSGRGRMTATGEFVRSLKPGDTVTVWAKARFPGWLNAVYEVKIDVFWAV